MLQQWRAGCGKRANCCDLGEFAAVWAGAAPAQRERRGQSCGGGRRWFPGKRLRLRSCSLPCVLGACNVLALRAEKSKSIHLPRPAASTARTCCPGGLQVQPAPASRLGGFKTFDFAHADEGASDVRDGDGAADDQSDVEGVDNLVAFPAFFAAAHEMIGYAIIAAQHGGGDQTEQFLGLRAERAGLVGLMVEGEEAFYAEVATAEDFFVEVRAKFL